MGDLSPHFSRHEFECPCCGICIVSADLLECLEWMRAMLGKPMTITSGCRCRKHNIEVGGYPTSTHICDEHNECRAADIKVDDSAHRRELVILAHEKFLRVGVAKQFIHVDVDTNAPQNVTWVY